MSCLKLFVVLITTLILSIPSLGLTEETKERNREVIKLEEITVRTKRGIDHAKVPAVVESLTSEDIKKMNVVGVEDVVKYQPALYVRKLGQAATNATFAYQRDQLTDDTKGVGFGGRPFIKQFFGRGA